MCNNNVIGCVNIIFTDNCEEDALIIADLLVNKVSNSYIKETYLSNKMSDIFNEIEWKILYETIKAKNMKQAIAIIIYNCLVDMNENRKICKLNNYNNE